ncbi:MATE family efflux transporter [Chitinivorax sp. B]|uniref:MATE family efflux transporter n=1 Tax=Chitinivorax sp. B TaxID=2502235 RepID=UPI0010F44C7B|nr:MATE family efflux transporter [Chitinivorax sp. B]
MPSRTPVDTPIPGFAVESRSILKLAGPIIIAQLAQTAMAFVDTVMAGRVSAADLAGVSLGASIWITIVLAFTGILLAVSPMIAQAYGGKRYQEIGGIMRQGMWLAVALGLIAIALLKFGAPAVLELAKAAPDVAEKATGFMEGVAVGMPAFLLYKVFNAYTASVSRTKPIMVISLLALALNVPANYVLIYGHFGLPAMGGAGCGWASALVNWFSLIALIAYTSRQRFYQQFELWRQFEWPRWSDQKRLLRLGLPIGLTYLAEVSAFTIVALMLARLGATVVASHQITLNFSAQTYMLPFGISSALTVRVGQHVGAGQYRLAAHTCKVGMQLVMLIALATAMLILLGAGHIAAMYTPDKAVQAMAVTLLMFAAAYQIPDAVQVSATGALRGYKVTTLPMVIQVVAFWIVGIFGGYMLGLQGVSFVNNGQPMGAPGFWTALVLSLTVAAAPLLAYLVHIARRFR